MTKQKWQLKTHEEKPNWGTGDYDEYYEVVNERGDALQATDDYEGLVRITETMNAFQGDIRITTALEINLHVESEGRKLEIEQLKAENERMRKALEVVANWSLPETGQYWDDDKTRPMSYGTCYGSNGERDYMKSIATEALK